MSLTTAETPLAWPATVAITDLRTCTSCSIQIYAPSPGTLQILSRRQGTGQGDGVNIEESNDVGADYRGQRYSIDEAILHVPGLHVFPGQTAPYPAEYHIHMKTFTAPIRYITVVFPVSHLVSSGSGLPYFAAAAAQLNPATVGQNPTLATLFTPGVQMIQYQGPDIRGRTAVSPEPLDPTDTTERQFLLMLQPLQIRASDLERIPREGSLSINPVDLPEMGVAPTKTVLRNRVIGYAVLATPGVPTGVGVTSTDASTNLIELECKPLKIIDGKDYIINTASSARSGYGAKNPMGLGSPQAVAADAGSSFDILDAILYSVTVFFTGMISIQLFHMFIFRLWFDTNGSEFKATLWQSYILPLILISMIIGYMYPSSTDNSS
jgi:hypothetical protein